MKRTIALIRHAKSDWSHAVSDFDRPLNGRGEHDAPRMGAELKARGIGFDLVIASPANRALTTARAICNEIGYPEEKIVQEQELYLSSPIEIIDVIRESDERFKRIAVVCHNPGLTMLANRLGGMKVDNMPTCSVAIFECKPDSWRDLEPGICKAVDFLYPKLFR